MVLEERPCADFPTTQLMQERITIRFRPGLELRLYSESAAFPSRLKQGEAGETHGKNMKKTHVGYILRQHHATLGPPNPVTPFFPFFLTRKPLLPFTFPGIPDEVAEVALLEVAHFERQRIHVRGDEGLEIFSPVGWGSSFRSFV